MRLGMKLGIQERIEAIDRAAIAGCGGHQHFSDVGWSIQSHVRNVRGAQGCSAFTGGGLKVKVEPPSIASTCPPVDAACTHAASDPRERP